MNGQPPRNGAPGPTRRVGSTSLRSLLPKLGRGVLWLFIALVVVRGLSSILNGPAKSTAPTVVAATNPSFVFPGDDARGFAITFARAYLSISGAQGATAGAAAAPYFDPSIAPNAAPTLNGANVIQNAGIGTVTGVQLLAPNEAIITVAVPVATRTSKRVTNALDYLNVPVFRDGQGGLAVFDLPSFASPPTLAQGYTSPANPLQGDSAGITDLVNRFLPPYVAGASAGQLAYFLAAGSTVIPPAPGLKLDHIGDISQTGSGGGSTRTLLVQAFVTDPTTGVQYPMRYRIDVQDSDRWYVSKVEGGN